jgi:hypothetical protein
MQVQSDWPGIRRESSTGMRDHQDTSSDLTQPALAGRGSRPEGPVEDRAAPSHPPSLARFYMTSDLRAATGLTRTHLDFYLREGIILPTARTESGYLLFDDVELATLRQVIAWRQDGIGIRDIRARLGRDGDAGTANHSRGGDR